jgi:hypothetical protein
MINFIFASPSFVTCQICFIIEYLEEDLADALHDEYLKEDLLALDYGEAKNAGARVKGVELYKRDRNEPDDPFRLPVQDLLGECHCTV